MVPEVWGCQEAPSLAECRITPLLPTAKTSLGPLPHTPLRALRGPGGLGVPGGAVVGGVQDRPLSPTAKTSLGPLPHTPLRICVVPEVWACQEAPSLVECRITPPCAHGEDVVGAAPPHAVEDLRGPRGLGLPGGAVVGGMQNRAAVAHGEDVVGAAPPHAVEGCGPRGLRDPGGGGQPVLQRLQPQGDRRRPTAP